MRPAKTTCPRRAALASLALLAALALGAPALAEAPPAADLGRVEFASSGAPEAQPAFLRGLAALHSFWYDEAADAFREAQRIDPGFALAYWGEAMTYDHPIWSQHDAEAGRAALARLAPTREERAAKAPTERERAWLAAVEVLFGDAPEAEREREYSEAMRRLSERWPEDLDAAAFYALSLIGPALTGPAGDLRDRPLIRAAAVLEERFDENPEHPGVLHYLIHAYDDPLHAPLGLRPARIYARVAPSAHHALHMPSHIFVQLGRWKEAAASNEDSWAASVAWVERRGLAPEKRDFHSLSWLLYADLQLGRLDKARRTLEIAKRAAEESGSARERGAAEGMEARWAVETGAWQPTGENAAERLRELSSAGRHGHGGELDAIVEKQAAGLEALGRGETEKALALLREAAELEERLPPPMGPPEPVKPSQELYADVLLAQGRAEEAAAWFDRALLRMPNRTASRLGAFRAATALGRSEEARRHAAALTETWSEADPGHPGVAELRKEVGARP
jgi:tetratricopeptide (TPR) repeat protein